MRTRSLGGTRLASLIVVALASLGAAGCARTFAAEVRQPNPLEAANETLRESEPIIIVTGDMDLEKPREPEPSQRVSLVKNKRYPLENVAAFTVVSRDRLRFHVQLEHKWQEWADLKTWEVYLIDDTGRKWVPESVEHEKVKLLTQMWDQEQRTAVCGQGGRDGKGDCITTVGFRNDGWRRRQPLSSLSVYRGTADFVFYQRDMFTSQVRWLKMVVKRSGESFEFLWRFEDTVASE